MVAPRPNPRVRMSPPPSPGQAPPQAILLCLSGHDPTGGAGIQADAEAAAAQGAHALTVITALTAQDSRNVRRVVPVDPPLIAEQLALLEADCRIGAIKIGLLGEPAQVVIIRDLLRRLRVPVVLDPVLRAGGGTELVGSPLQAALLEQLLPEVSLLTPNAAELRRLAPGAADLAAAARELMDRGCANLLVTGGDEPGDRVVNTWFCAGAAPRRFEWPRLAETFHGAGCTLASAVAARLALGEPMAGAIEQAQRWTQDALARAFAVGQGRRIPFRR